MTRQDLTGVLALPPVNDVGEVARRLRLLERVLSQEDGLFWFTRVYVRTASSIARALAQGGVPGRRFLERLDVRFVNYYLDVIRNHESGGQRVPRSWEALFERRSHRGVTPIQFALAGLHAHINHDLPIVLVETFGGGEPTRTGAAYRGYLEMNAVLAKVHEAMKRWLFSKRMREADERLGRLDDLVRNWGIAAARESAWTWCERLWRTRRSMVLSNLELDALDRWTGALGHFLLIHVPP